MCQSWSSFSTFLVLTDMFGFEVIQGLLQLLSADTLNSAKHPAFKRIEHLHIFGPASIIM